MIEIYMALAVLFAITLAKPTVRESALGIIRNSRNAYIDGKVSPRQIDRAVESRVKSLNGAEYVYGQFFLDSLRFVSNQQSAIGRQRAFDEAYDITARINSIKVSTSQI